MNEVKRHVEKLFSSYPKTSQTADLKEEVMGNLEAEIEDLQSGGFSYEEAFLISTERMGSLKGLVDGMKTIRLYSLAIQLFQWALIYLLIAWFVTMPFSMYPWIKIDSYILFAAILVIGAMYLILIALKGVLSTFIVNIDLMNVVKLHKLLWFLWIIFMLFSWVRLSGLLFGSTIWFGRPISINGPYEFAGIVSRYVTPTFSIIIPLLMYKLKTKMERQEEEEDE